MEWVRGHQRFGAWLAFVALAFQLVLAFGHVHLGRFAAAGIATTVMASLMAPSQASVAELPRQAPAQNPGDDDDYCAICASIHVTSTSFIAHAPLLPVPSGFERIAHSLAVASGTTEPRRVAFRSRAPPAA